MLFLGSFIFPGFLLQKKVEEIVSLNCNIVDLRPGGLSCSASRVATVNVYLRVDGDCLGGLLLISRIVADHARCCLLDFHQPVHRCIIGPLVGPLLGGGIGESALHQFFESLFLGQVLLSLVLTYKVPTFEMLMACSICGLLLLRILHLLGLLLLLLLLLSVQVVRQLLRELLILVDHLLRSPVVYRLRKGRFGRLLVRTDIGQDLGRVRCPQVVERRGRLRF